MRVCGRNDSHTHMKRKLTATEAVMIYKLKFIDSPKKAHRVGEWFGVSDKTVRDIWCGRCWSKETAPLDPQRVSLPGASKPVGRPKGSKDLGMRKSRIVIKQRPLTIDDQLYEWSERIWFDPSRPDPV
jgi:hypothetical protein